MECFCCIFEMGQDVQPMFSLSVEGDEHKVDVETMLDCWRSHGHVDISTVQCMVYIVACKK